jgi:hypothetical protein
MGGGTAAHIMTDRKQKERENPELVGFLLLPLLVHQDTQAVG